jgi:sec-independent protein translocase protein TatA
MATSPVFFAAFGLGGMELVLILAIVLLLFGGAKLPSLARGLGQSIKEFKKASRDEEEPAKPAATAEVEAKKPVEVSKTHGAN